MFGTPHKSYLQVVNSKEKRVPELATFTLLVIMEITIDLIVAQIYLCILQFDKFKYNNTITMSGKIDPMISRMQVTINV